jgi:hypothetical protein
MKERRTAFMTDSVLRPDTFATSDDEEFAILYCIKFSSTDVTTVAGWDDVLGGVVSDVAVDVIGEQPVFSTLSSGTPSNWLSTPVTGMSTRSNPLVKNDGMDSDRFAVWGERMSDNPGDDITGHDWTLALEVCSS